jgi:hypothetical protein
LYFSLVGNKVDLVHAGHKTREVDLEEAIAFAKEENFDYIETSALTGHSVEAMFRRLIFSVAKLIPDVQNNLDIAALPEGWIIKLPCATDHNNNKDKEGRERAASDDAATTMETTSTSANSYMTSKSPRSLDSRLKSTERRKSAILRVQYLNYWTGELHNEMPYTPAQPTLLHTANPPPPKTKERTSSAASTTAAAANKEEPRSTSSRKSVAKSTSSASSHIDMLSDEPVPEENKNNNDDKNNITDDITNRDPTRSNSISESSSRRKQLYREDSKNRERPSIE